MASVVTSLALEPATTTRSSTAVSCASCQQVERPYPVASGGMFSAQREGTKALAKGSRHNFLTRVPGRSILFQATLKTGQPQQDVVLRNRAWACPERTEAKARAKRKGFSPPCENAYLESSHRPIPRRQGMGSLHYRPFQHTGRPR